MAENLPHILSARQFDIDQIEEIFEQTDRMYHDFAADRVVLHRRHEAYQLSTTFYEPSTRTRKSFESAAQALGMDINTTEMAKQFSSAAKGEILKDTVMTEAQYSDIILLRHDEQGAADQAAEVSPVPIINGGDGPGEHPTQALLDLYTIKREKGRTDDLHVVIGGDLVKGRTARSLAMMLSHYKGNHITFVSLPELSIDERVKAHLRAEGITFDETSDMHGALPTADVVYWTRLQLERHAKREERKEREVLAALKLIGMQLDEFIPGSEHQEAAGILRSIGALATDMLAAEEPEEEMSAVSLARNYVIAQAELDVMMGNAVIMHPLPRNNEISQTVDQDPRAKYFVQMKHGKFLRMALLDQIIGTLKAA